MIHNKCHVNLEENDPVQLSQLLCLFHCLNFGYTYMLSYFASLSGVGHCALLSGIVLLNVIFALQNRWYTFFMFLLPRSS